MRIALVTGVPAPHLVEVVDATDRPLAVELTTRGAAVERPVWHDPDVDWASFDAAIIRTAWDYPGRHEVFVAWAERVGGLTQLYNSAEVVRWNTHKSYLLELEERGAPTVPTAWLGRGDRVDLAALLEARDWKRAIVKPVVASGSDGVQRVARDGAAEPRVTVRPGTDEVGLAAGQQHLDALLATGDAMVQPYVTSIETRGELSVVVIDGAVTHAVRKRPVEGEFRIQEEFGGRYVAETPTPEAAELARWIVEACGTPLLFARVDLLEAEDGTLQLAELEATEPDLYHAIVPGAAAPLADAIVARLGAA